MTLNKEELTYKDHDGALREVRGCSISVDALDRYWIWSDQLNQNLVYRTKGRENALLAAIDSLLFNIELRDSKIAALQRTADLAQQFAAQINSNDEDV